jgi:hypothetical protein
MRAVYFMAAFVSMAAIGMLIAREFFSPGGSLEGQQAGSGEFVSGPQVGSKIPGPFEPLNINGENAGEGACLYCRYGNAPVVMIFAAKPSKALTVLIRSIEKAAVEAGKTGEVGACVVITESNDVIKDALFKLADKENLKKVVLGMIDPRHLKKNYKLHSDAEVTVLLYSNQFVRVNHAYKAGEMTEKVAAEVGEEAAKFLTVK